MAIHIALVGNPNAGKTTLFNALTGSHQFVGNWPGVTVEKKEGALLGESDRLVVDLPGVYSLSPYTPEEVITRRFLLDEKPDVILNIVDGMNLERNLYLTTQLLELGIPLLLAVNRMDAVERMGDGIDTERLGRELGCAVVTMSALKGEGVVEAAQLACDLAVRAKVNPPKSCFHGSIEHALAHIEERLLHDWPESLQRFYAIKLFERDAKVREQLALSRADMEHIDYDIKLCEAEWDDDAESIIISGRYDYIQTLVARCCTRRQRKELNVSQRLDRVLTHRVYALPIFALIMLLVYYVSVTLVGGLSARWTDALLGSLSERLPALLPVSPWMESLLLDGLLAGVGSVLGFVPQMLALFFSLAVLESCGYMSRIAFILDRVFRRFGLSGKAFIPLLIGTGCGVPGVMASRTIENPKERRMTIITTTFIPCGAKLPMIAMIAGAFFGGAWWVAPSAYFMGIAAVLLSGLLLKKTRLFAGGETPFVMELPLYHLPLLRNVLRSTWERTYSFIKKAGTIILLASLVIWFTSRFGWMDGQFVMLSEDALSSSILAKLGSLIAWVFAPLGFGTWQAATATLLGLLAKEGVVSTMSVLYGVADGGYAALQAAFTPAAGYAFLAFNLLCAPCFAAIAAIRQEMKSGAWFAFALAYQTAFAYLASLLLYQLGRLARWDLVLLLVVILLVCFALGSMRRSRRKGEMCSAGCAGCSGHCHKP